MAVLDAAPVTATKGRAADLLDAIRKIISAQAGHGQCRLKFVSATNLRLDPFGGRNLIINGVPRLIPAAGVTLSNGGLSANTLYYAYAYMNGSTMTLEGVVASHSQDATTGVEIKTGDVSRSLVGMFYTNAASQFSDSATARLVASWFNRISVGAGISSSTTYSYNNTSATEITSALRVQFLSWAGESVDARATGQYTCGASQSVSAQLYIDGTPYGNLSATYVAVSASGFTYASGNSLTPAGAYLSEGQHLATLFGGVTGSTGSLTQTAHSITTRI
ncbi:hypothetical protein D3C87_1412330 [compost metagenome]